MLAMQSVAIVDRVVVELEPSFNLYGEKRCGAVPELPLLQGVLDGNADGNAAELWQTGMNYNERSTLKFNTQ